MSPQEQVQNLNQKALRIASASKKVKVDIMLERRPDLHDSAIQHMVAMGCAEPTDAEVHEYQEKKKKGQSAEKTTAASSLQRSASGLSVASDPSGHGQLSVGASASAAGETELQSASQHDGVIVLGQKKLEEYIPTCNTYFDMVKPLFWQYIFQKLNPSSLSIQAQRALSPNKHIPKQVVHDLLEFLTGIKRQDPLPPTWHHLPYLTYICEQLHAKRHKPAIGLVLPPNYNDMGVFSVRDKPDGQYLFHRHLYKDARLPDDVQGKVSAATAKFVNNHSESQSHLVVSATFKHHCVLSFPGAAARLSVDIMEHSAWISQLGQAMVAEQAPSIGAAAQATPAKAACPPPPSAQKIPDAVDEAAIVPPAPAKEGN
eukprot:853390-Amphidinium_carterae.3